MIFGVKWIITHCKNKILKLKDDTLIIIVYTYLSSKLYAMQLIWDKLYKEIFFQTNFTHVKYGLITIE